MCFPTLQVGSCCKREKKKPLEVEQRSKKKNRISFSRIVIFLYHVCSAYGKVR